MTKSYLRAGAGSAVLLSSVFALSPVMEGVTRGGRLVIYTYCISILVMTFKRPADIRRPLHFPAN